MTGDLRSPARGRRWLLAMRDHLVRLRGMTEAARCAAIIALAGTALAVAGCGSSGGTASSTSPRGRHRDHRASTTSSATANITGARSGAFRRCPRRPSRPASPRPPADQRERLPDRGVPRRRGDVDAGVRGGRSAVHAGAIDDLPRPGRIPRAERRAPPWAPSTARPIAASTSTRGSSTRSVARSASGSGPSRAPTWSRTRSPITCRCSSASPVASGRPTSRTRRARTRARCASSCRRTASPASGSTPPTSADSSPQTDFEDALRAAAIVGDDFQQRRATGTITPEDWTHGSSQQRQHWLTTGFQQGQPGACDTFGS